MSWRHWATPGSGPAAARAEKTARACPAQAETTVPPQAVRGRHRPGRARVPGSAAAPWGDAVAKTTGGTTRSVVATTRTIGTAAARSVGAAARTVAAKAYGATARGFAVVTATGKTGGRSTGLAAYRQPALLAGLIAVVVMLMTDPPATGTDPRQTAAEATDGPASTPVEGGGNPHAQTSGEKTSGEKKTVPGAAPPGKGRTTPGHGPVTAPDRPAPEAAGPGASVPPTAPATPSTSPSPTRPVFGPAQSKRLTGTDAVALTFDDGPDPVQTPRLLDLLAKQKVKATFCVVGFRAQAHPELIRRIVADGHTVCNHSWDHSLTLGKKSTEEIEADLERTNAAIRTAEPDVKITYFRAPGGNFTAELVAGAGNLGMTSLYWEVDPRDWEHPESETPQQHLDRVIRSIERRVRKGSIVLSHDFNQPQTITAYETLLPRLQEQFELIPMPVRP